jgi:hypothetical protein
MLAVLRKAAPYAALIGEITEGPPRVKTIHCRASADRERSPRNARYNLVRHMTANRKPS